MTQTNLPILYQNIMAGLPSDLACDAFLWATERADGDPMLYHAEAFAREVHDLAATLRVLLNIGAKVHGLQCYDLDLQRFMLRRHANWRFGSNLRPDYCEATA